MRVEHQHGDVILELVKSIPEKAVKLKFEDGFIVEKGEGVHIHTLSNPLKLKDSTDNIEIWSIDDTIYIKVKKEAILDHEEHGKQIIKEGIYKKHIEREYNYEDNEERRVID